MRRDDQSRLALCQALEVRERPYLLGTPPKIEEQHVTAFDRLFDSRNQDQAAFGGIGLVRRDVELSFVQGDRERVIATGDGCVNQLGGGMGDPIERGVGRVRMEFDLQHTAVEFVRNRAKLWYRRIGRGSAWVTSEPTVSQEFADAEDFNDDVTGYADSLRKVCAAKGFCRCSSAWRASAPYRRHPGRGHARSDTCLTSYPT